jgi:hypothetical protein
MLLFFDHPHKRFSVHDTFISDPANLIWSCDRRCMKMGNQSSSRAAITAPGVTSG